MKTHLLWLALLFPAIACQGSSDRATDPDDSVLVHADGTSLDDEDDDGDDEGDEVTIGPDRIPEAVATAARAALPGLVIEEAEIEEGGAIYCVHGRVGGVFYEVEVAADGSSAEVEDDDEDDED